MKTAIKLKLLFLCLFQSAFAMADTEAVKHFVDAFNQKNSAAMLALAAPEMKWLSVSGHHISVETSNHDELEKAMKSYFKSMPSAKSTIRDIRQSGQFVYSLEEAFWTVNDVVKSQCSMAVYELLEDKIQHVWYFPSHQC